MRQVVHVEPAVLDAAARRLLKGAWDIWEEAIHLRLTLARLEMVWQGGRSEEDLQELRCLQRALLDHARHLEEQALMLMRQAERWEECDRRWAAVFRDHPFRLFGE